MIRSSYLQYKRTFVEAARSVLAQGGSDVLSEAALPAYSNPNPLISFLFWRRIQKVMNFLEGVGRRQKVLDFGTGGGVMLPFLAHLSEEVIAMDLDLMPARKISILVGCPGNVSFQNAAERPLSTWDKGTFDVILALDVLEHVDDLPGIIANLARVMTPKGILIVSGPTENVFYRLGRRFAGKEYSGHYHVRNIYDIKRELIKSTRLSTLATLYYPLPLFKVYACRRLEDPARIASLSTS
jgi:2-polyprenyl-3-methyl-5-hydroxy-6-metoxy-1,4-benzoquinol methylase